MNYKELIDDYQLRGIVSEKKMLESIEILDGAMMCLKEQDPDVYDETIRAIHRIFCGPHYNSCFAKQDVAKMHHKNLKGEEKRGEHWNIEQVKEVAKNFSFPTNTTPWDIYVALNANWHDKNVSFKKWFGDDCDSKIIDDAISFYFKDDDAPDGKIWIYQYAMNK